MTKPHASLTARLILAFAVFSFSATAQTLTITNGIQTYAALANTTVTMTGHSELIVTAASNPIRDCLIHLNSPDAWFLLPGIKPSVVVSAYLGQVRVNGAPAVADSTVRVTQFDMGSVVIPHAPGYLPLQVFSGANFLGASLQLGQYTFHTDANLGALQNAISSFKLKRGYMATFAQNASGTGVSKVYIAQDGDLDVGVLTASLDDSISFVRVVPWRWTSKKGWAGGVEPIVNPQWNYDWDNATISTRDTEYVPMRHNLNWNAYANINNKRNSTHALGFNEPDRPDQANMSVAQAIAQWPNLLASGLRLGSPAPSDAGAGLTWLYDFMEQADALNYRVDYVAVHFYKGGWTASQYYNWLLDIHRRTGRPIWITEFNNGANWTCCEPTLASQATIIGQFIDMLDNAPFVERYAIYNWVGANRELVTGGMLNPAGVVYRDNASPLAYAQELPAGGTRNIAQYPFDNNALDSSGFGNNGFPAGIPAYAAGVTGQAIELDGVDDFVRLPVNLGDSSDFTFAAWVFWDGGANWQRIFDFGSGPNQYVYLSPSSGANTLRLAIRNGGAEQIVDTTRLAAGQWVHLAVTLAGDSGRIFVNGAPVAANHGMTINPASLNTSLNYLGKSQFAADPLFNGRLDDVLIADYALTGAQIASLIENQPPAFTNDFLVRPNASPGQAYSDTIAGTAIDTDAGDTLAYSKASGPAWLTVAANGTLIGSPDVNDGGTNTFGVRVTDAAGVSDFAILTIYVNNQANPVARYEFDGSTLSSVGVAHGVLNGPANYVAGHLAQAIDLDGANNFVTLPAGVANSDDITIAA